MASGFWYVAIPWGPVATFKQRADEAFTAALDGDPDSPIGAHITAEDREAFDALVEQCIAGRGPDEQIGAQLHDPRVSDDPITLHA